MVTLTGTPASSPSVEMKGEQGCSKDPGILSVLWKLKATAASERQSLSTTHTFLSADRHLDAAVGHTGAEGLWFCKQAQTKEGRALGFR